MCEAVTCLVQTLICSIDELTDSRPDYDLDKGDFQMDIEDLGADAQLLLDSFYIGAELLASAYPESIQASRHGRR